MEEHGLAAGFSAANLKTAIKAYGPLVIGFNADDLYSSVADLKANYVYHTPTDNHSVSLVGYADDDTCPTGGYWIIKNSWGTAPAITGFSTSPTAVPSTPGSITSMPSTAPSTTRARWRR